jgi:hypothetical protein
MIAADLLSYLILVVWAALFDRVGLLTHASMLASAFPKRPAASRRIRRPPGRVASFETSHHFDVASEAHHENRGSRRASFGPPSRDDLPGSAGSDARLSSPGEAAEDCGGADEGEATEKGAG